MMRCPKLPLLTLLATLTLPACASELSSDDALSGDASTTEASYNDVLGPLPDAPPPEGKADYDLLTGNALGARVLTRKFITGTPTYGSPATESFLKLEVEVSDRHLRASHADFDGLEQAFALVPRRLADGSIQWEGHRIPFAHEDHYGYFGEQRADHHATDWHTGADFDTIRELGVAFGIQTNVGTIWLQDPGDNWPLEKVGPPLN